MTTPEIIGSIRSTYTRVVCMVCEEKGIEYVLTEKPLRAPEILAIHPFGKMPVLRHGDFVLFESKASPPISIAPSRPRASFRPILASGPSPSNGFHSSIR
jgi:hypothetical protein